MPGCSGLRRQVRKLAKGLAANIRGSLTTTFALSAPVLMASLGLAVDFVNYNRVKSELQAAADAAAIAGAREIQVAKTDEKQVTSAAVSFAAYKLTGNSDIGAGALAERGWTVSAAVINASSSVKVDVTERWTPFFAHFLKAGITPVAVSATARFVGSNNICVLGLSGSGSSVFLDRYARLTGNQCGVYSNSTQATGFKVNLGSILSSSLNCSAGGSDVSQSATVNPRVLTDCPIVKDPLAGRPPPAVGGCEHIDLYLKDETRTLNPGVYCGGMTLVGASKITLSPGTYIIKDGPLQASGQTSLRGDGVSFFITGATPGKVHFAMNTHISLSAPTDGAMAGLLFYEDRTIKIKLKHQITSDDARQLTGTIYMPVGDLIVDAKQPVADQSAYTAIIVDKLLLNGGPNLILNSNFSGTKVPVPEGLKGTGQVVLTE